MQESFAAVLGARRGGVGLHPSKLHSVLSDDCVPTSNTTSGSTSFKRTHEGLLRENSVSPTLFVTGLEELSVKRMTGAK